MTSPSIQPGWYPTADGAHERFHDGNQWTDATRTVTNHLTGHLAEQAADARPGSTVADRGNGAPRDPFIAAAPIGSLGAPIRTRIPTAPSGAQPGDLRERLNTLPLAAKVAVPAAVAVLGLGFVFLGGGGHGPSGAGPVLTPVTGAGSPAPAISSKAPPSVKPPRPSGPPGKVVTPTIHPSGWTHDLSTVGVGVPGQNGVPMTLSGGPTSGQTQTAPTGTATPTN